MYGLNELKPRLGITDDTVECPVLGCKTIVPRQRNHFQHSEQFFCTVHNIYIGPSTFEYQNQGDNLLWHDEHDQAFLKAVHKHKRESRMVRDNSEDALTWNVFRYLDLSGQLDAVLSSCIGTAITESQPVYWSYSHPSESALKELNHCREQFGEEIRRSSEPDLIVVSKEAVIWIEVKLNATNSAPPGNPLNLKKYLSGGDGWFKKAFQSDYQAIVVDANRYELMRFWLLGSWMAADMKRKFVLINLVKSGREETKFQNHIRQHSQRSFLTCTWENLYHLIETIPTSSDTRRERMLHYFRNKSVGYNQKGTLLPAFPTLLNSA